MVTSEAKGNQKVKVIQSEYIASRKKHIFINKKGFVFDVYMKLSKGAKIRNRYNQVPHPTQDTNGKVTNSQ